jgi:tripartite-type tricarboxylate transporter receptor subunit TctC
MRSIFSCWMKGVVFLFVFCVAFTMGLPALFAASAKYPEKPITFIVNFAAGGISDLIARVLARPMGEDLGQPVLVVNKVGAGGVIGFLEVEKAPPDGYMIGTLAISSILTQYTSPNPTNIYNTIPVSFVTSGPATLTVKGDAPWKNVAEFIAHAKTNPGKIRNANSGTGGSAHIFAAALDSVAGIKQIHVPFNGYAPAIAALAGGHVEATCSPVGDVQPLVKAGKLKILGVASEERHFLFPDISTFKEQGVAFAIGNLQGVVVPKGTPLEIVEVLDNSIKKALQRPEVKKAFEEIGYPVAYKNSKDFGELMKEQDPFLRELVEKLGLFVAPKK